MLPLFSGLLLIVMFNGLLFLVMSYLFIFPDCSRHYDFFSFRVGFFELGLVFEGGISTAAGVIDVTTNYEALWR